MSLNWDVTKCDPEKWKKNPYLREVLDANGGKPTGNPLTDCLVWMTIAIDVGDWSAKNMDEVVWRAAFLQKLTGGYLSVDGKPYAIPEDVIRAHEGLQTNVFPMSTRLNWVKRKVKNWNPQRDGAKGPDGDMWEKMANAYAEGIAKEKDEAAG